MKPNPENFIKCYSDADFARIWNQDKGEPVSVISRAGYVITYAEFTIIWASRLQT